MIEVLVTLWASGFFLGLFTKDILSLFEDKPAVVWSCPPIERPPPEAFERRDKL